MAKDFSTYLGIAVESVERPMPPPLGHYHATIKAWKTDERDYAKATGGPKTPVVEISYTLTSPGSDVDTDLLPPGGIAGRVVSRDYTLNDETGPYMLRQLGEELCDLDVKGLSLGDMLPLLVGQEVGLYLEQRAGSGNTEGQFFPVVKKVLKAEAVS